MTLRERLDAAFAAAYEAGDLDPQAWTEDNEQLYKRVVAEHREALVAEFWKELDAKIQKARALSHAKKSKEGPRDL